MIDSSKTKLSEADFAAIVNYRRGVIPAILCGLTDVDLENQDSELARHWAYLVERIAALQPNVNRVQLLLDKALKDDERKVS